MMPTRLVLLSVLLTAGCHTGTRTPPSDDAAAAEALEASLDEISARVLEHIQGDLGELFATQQERTHLSNSLSSVQNELRQLTAEINSLKRKLEDPQTSTTWRTYVQEQTKALENLTDRLGKVERDLNTSVNDIFNLRKEVRAVVEKLDAYVNAYRASLQQRRDALLQELQVLDSALQPVAGTTGSPSRSK